MDATRLYLSEIGASPLLTADEEKHFARLAQAGDAAMLPYYPERKADGSGYRLHIEPPLPNFPSGDEVSDATAINASIENWVRRFPGNYMWIHQRFKTRPPGEDPFYP